MGQGPFTSAVVQTFPRAIATARGTKSTLWASAEAVACSISTAMGCAIQTRCLGACTRLPRTTILRRRRTTAVAFFLRVARRRRRAVGVRRKQRWRERSGDLLQLLTEFGQTCTPLRLRRSCRVPNTIRHGPHRRPVLVRGEPAQHALHKRRHDSVQRRKWPMGGFVRRG